MPDDLPTPEEMTEFQARAEATGLSVRKIAVTLNEEGISSPGGGAWHIANVHRSLKRVSA
jgi:hypothetical protein